MVTELAQTSCNAAVNDKTREVILNIFLFLLLYIKNERKGMIYFKKRKGKRKKKEKQEKRDDQVVKKK
jgi:hypothetical protein